MKATFSRNIVYIFIVFLCSGCSVFRPSIPGELQRSFEEIMGFSNANKVLKAKLIGVERHKFGVDINILIENVGESPISLSTEANDLFVKIYTIRNGQWVELGNNVTYSSIQEGEDIVLDQIHGKLPNEFIVLVRPVFEQNPKNENNKEMLRILFTGKVADKDNNSDSMVGAYVDLEVER